jgi:peptidoglycan/xylan/chitin deacetylase (PgdA/CDA1 family)
MMTYRPEALARRKLPPLALAYHGVANVPLHRDPYRLFVRPRDLERHIQRLRAWGFRLVTFGELATRAAAGEAAGHAALTFDDGLADNLTAALPVIRRSGAPATVFVVSGWLGGTHPKARWAPILTADDIRALAGAGVEIGAHTSTHPDLTELEHDAARAELARCKEELEKLTDRAVDVAAYPFGNASSDTMRACASAGFRAACRTSGQGSWSEPLNLPRQDMDNRCTAAGFWLKRHGWYEPVVATPPGRLARRAIREARGVLG